MENPKAKAFLSVELFEGKEGKTASKCTIGGGELMEKMQMVTILMHGLLNAGMPPILLELAVQTAFENKQTLDGMIDEKIVMAIPDSIGSTNKEES